MIRKSKESLYKEYLLYKIKSFLVNKQKSLRKIPFDLWIKKFKSYSLQLIECYTLEVAIIILSNFPPFHVPKLIVRFCVDFSWFPFEVYGLFVMMIHEGSSSLKKEPHGL